VIVVSILLAFAVQTAWEQLGESRRRNALLDALTSDMLLAASEVDRVMQVDSAGFVAASAILDVDPGALSVDQAPLIDSLLTVVLGSASYDAPLGALEALLSSGDLGVLNDAELTLDLTAFPALVADLDREQRLLLADSDEARRYLHKVGIDSSQLQVGRDVPWTIHPTRSFTVVGDAGFRGPVAALWYRFRNTSEDLASIREAIVRIQERLARHVRP